MAKKKEEDIMDFPPVNEGEDEPLASDPEDALAGLDFDVKDEYKPDPLLLNGSYRANVTKVVFDPKQSAIVWTGVIVDSDRLMSDGESSADGVTIQWRNWLPKPGDELEPTKDGKKTKRQSKINMLEDYQRKLGIDMSTPQIIAQSLLEQTWLGLQVIVDIVISEWEGRTRNEVKKITAG